MRSKFAGKKNLKSSLKKSKPRTQKKFTKEKTNPASKNRPSTKHIPSSERFQSFAWQDLPFSYNETRLGFLVRDPFWAYTYWDFSAETWNWMEAFLEKDPLARFVLRIHNLDLRTSYDVEVDRRAKSWYLDLGRPDTNFEAEIGIRDSRNQFFSLAKSNRIRTPRNRPSEKIDPHWDPAEFGFDWIYEMSGGGKTRFGSLDLFSNFKRPPVLSGNK